MGTHDEIPPPPPTGRGSIPPVAKGAMGVTGGAGALGLLVYMLWQMHGDVTERMDDMVAQQAKANVTLSRVADKLEVLNEQAKEAKDERKELDKRVIAVEVQQAVQNGRKGGRR